MPNDIQLGHALRMTNEAWDRGQDLTEISAEALRIAAGLEKLVARAPAPQFREAVEHAERQIGIDPHDPERPVYAYIGDLHAHLGQVGLVFHRDWARRCLHGFTRCDSGGMVGGFGNFGYALPPELRSAGGDVRNGEAEVKRLTEALPPPPHEALEQAQARLLNARARLQQAKDAKDLAVRSLTVLAEKKPNVVEILDYELDREINDGFEGLGDPAGAYVKNLVPRFPESFNERYQAMLPHANITGGEAHFLSHSHAQDPRKLCSAGALRDKVPQDRRIWNWEVRMSESPEADDLCAVLLSPEGAKVFMSERLKERLRREVFAAVRDGTDGRNTVQLDPNEVAPHVKIVTSGTNRTYQSLAGLEQHTSAAPWFYSPEARQALRRCG